MLRKESIIRATSNRLPKHVDKSSGDDFYGRASQLKEVSEWLCSSVESCKWFCSRSPSLPQNMELKFAQKNHAVDWVALLWISLSDDSLFGEYCSSTIVFRPR